MQTDKIVNLYLKGSLKVVGVRIDNREARVKVARSARR